VWIIRSIILLSWAKRFSNLRELISKWVINQWSGILKKKIPVLLPVSVSSDAAAGDLQDN